MANKARINNARRAAQRALIDLDEPGLRVARDFLAFLRFRASDPATLEILQSPALMRDIKAAQTDLRKGTVDRFIAWRTRKVHV